MKHIFKGRSLFKNYPTFLLAFLWIRLFCRTGLMRGKDGTNRMLHSFLALPQLNYPDML